MPCEVRLAKEDEDSFNPGCGGALKACFVCNVEVDVIINIHVVGFGDWLAIDFEDSGVYGVGNTSCEWR